MNRIRQTQKPWVLLRVTLTGEEPDSPSRPRWQPLRRSRVPALCLQPKNVGLKILPHKPLRKARDIVCVTLSERRSLCCIRSLFTPHRNLPSDDAAQLANRVGAAMFQVSSLVSSYASLNTFPSALNVDPRCFLHFLNSLGLFFRCSNADATTSALGMSGSAAIEKHVDLPWCEIRRTNL